MRGLGAVLLVVVLAGTARADEVGDLVARGEALAKQGEFTGAIEVFKQADAKQPRAAHACLIGLVYTRRELWPQAELFFARCRARATPEDPLPPWIDKAERQLVEKLSADGAAAITIVVTPPAAKAQITVSSFAPDEVFEPRTIHLAPGRHVVDVSADGYAPGSREVVVQTNDAQTVTIDLVTVEQAAAAKTPPPPPPIKPPPPPPPARSFVPTAVMLGGVALALGGGAVELFAVKPARDSLTSAPDDAIYDARSKSFKERRDATIALYAGAAAAVATGLVLRYTVYAHPSMSVSASIDPHGAALTIGWSR